MNFQKFSSKNKLLKKSQNFDFSKKWGKNSKFQKNNRIFEIPVPKNIKYHEEI